MAGVASLMMIGVFILLLLLILRWSLRRYQLVKSVSWAPGPPSLPFIGSVGYFIGKDQSELTQLLIKFRDAYGPIFQYFIGLNPVFIVQDAASMQALSGTGKNAYKSIEYDFLANFLGQSLLTSSGETWFHKRKLLTPCFHYEILDNFVIEMNLHARKFIKYLERYVDQTSSFNFLPLAKLTTLDVLMDTSIGVNINALESENSPYVLAINKMCNIIIKRSISLLLRYDFFYNLSPTKKEEVAATATIMGFVRDVIHKKREQRMSKIENPDANKKGEKRKALLDLLLDLADSGTQITDTEMESEVNTFIFAGHDTTSAAISYIVHLLGKHLDVQERVVEELNELAPNLKDEDLTQTTLNKLEYMDRCIKESLRMFPPVPLIGKKFKQPLILERGTIPPDVDVVGNIYNLHNDHAIFPNPHKFDPDRFLLDNVTTRSAYSYIPFGSGARNCIGQRFAMLEIRTILAHLLKNFKIESSCSSDNLKIGFDIVLTPMNGIPIQISRR